MGDTSVIDALNSTSRVTGLTHNHYRYPARFSPKFVRAVLDEYSAPGDIVLDPFVGGGTTAVESLVSGRRFVGGDLNQLAVFIARAKTTPLTRPQAQKLRVWADDLIEKTASAWRNAEIVTAEDTRLPWTLRRTLTLGLAELALLKDPLLARVARTSLLRTAQWALDGRRELPTREQFMQKHRLITSSMASGAVEFGEKARSAFSLSSIRHLSSKRRYFVSPASTLAQRIAPQREWMSPRLILTSPPYPGVHILYHRWQVKGRRESDAPYWLSATNDGRPASYYTFGPRITKERPIRDEYFARVKESFIGLRSVCSPNTIIVQLVGFAYPESQLPMYRDAMYAAGFTEIASEESLVPADQIEREVPNRKWYLDALNRETGSSREFLLVHRVS